MSNETILIVDGDARNQKVLEVSLKKAGYRVVLADTIDTALDYLSEETPDLIVSETDLPDGEGFEFCRQVRSYDHLETTPFVFLAEDGEWTDKVQGLELGADDYLTRPVYVRELLTRVEALLQERERRLLSEDAETFRGDLDDITVLDLLQTIDRREQTGDIRFERGDEEATLLFRDGDILDAMCGKLQGEEAFYRLMLWPEGEFVIEYRDDVEGPEHIEADIDTLMMEGVERLEAWNEHVERLPSFDRVFEADYRKMPDFLETVPDEVARVARLFDGVRTLRDVVDASPVDDVTAVQIIARIFDEGVLEDVTPDEATSPAESSRDRATSHLSAWLAPREEGESERLKTTRRGMPGPRESGEEHDEDEARTRQTTREYYRSVQDEETVEREDTAPSEEYEVVEPGVGSEGDESAREDDADEAAPGMVAASLEGQEVTPDDEDPLDEEALEQAKVRAQEGGAFEEVDLKAEGAVAETVEELQEAEQRRREREARRLAEEQSTPETQTSSEIDDPDDTTARADTASHSPEETDGGRPETASERERTRDADDRPETDRTEDDALDESATPGLGDETTEPDWLEEETELPEVNDEADAESPETDNLSAPDSDDDIQREFQVDADLLDTDRLEERTDSRDESSLDVGDPGDVSVSPNLEPEPDPPEDPSRDADTIRPRDSSPIPHPDRDETARGISPWGEPDAGESSDETLDAEGDEEADERDVPVSFQRVEDDQDASSSETSSSPQDSSLDSPEVTSEDDLDAPSTDESDELETGLQPDESGDTATPGQSPFADTTSDGEDAEASEELPESSDVSPPDDENRDEDAADETTDETDEARDDDAANETDDARDDETTDETDHDLETDEYEAVSREQAEQAPEADGEGISPVDIEDEESEDIGRVSENGEIVRVEYDLGQSEAHEQREARPDDERDDASDSAASTEDEVDDEADEPVELEDDASEDDGETLTWGDTPADERAGADELAELREDETADELEDDEDASEPSDKEPDADELAELREDETADELEDDEDASEPSDEEPETDTEEKDEGSDDTEDDSGTRDSPLGARFTDSTSDETADEDDDTKADDGIADTDDQAVDASEMDVLPDDESDESSADTEVEPEAETDEVGRDTVEPSNEVDEDDGEKAAGFAEEDEEAFFVDDEEETLDPYADDAYDGDDRWQRWAITAAIIGLVGTAFGFGIWQSQDDSKNGSASDGDETVASSEEPETTSSSSDDDTKTSASGDDEDESTESNSVPEGLDRDKARARAEAMTQSVGTRAEDIASALEFPSPPADEESEGDNESTTPDRAVEQASADETPDESPPESPASPRSGSEEAKSSDQQGGDLASQIARARQLVNAGRLNEAYSLLDNLWDRDPGNGTVSKLLLSVASRFQTDNQDCRAKRAYESYLTHASGQQADQIRGIVNDRIDCQR